MKSRVLYSRALCFDFLRVFSEVIKIRNFYAIFLSNLKLSFSGFWHLTQFAFSKTLSLKCELLHSTFEWQYLVLRSWVFGNFKCNLFPYIFATEHHIYHWIHLQWIVFTVCKNKLNHTLCTYTTHRFVVMSNLEIIYSECLITKMNMFICDHIPQSVTV